MLPHGLRAEAHRLAAPPRPPRAAVAGHARPVPDLALGGHAAADPGRGGNPLLRALPGPLSRRAGARRGAPGRSAASMERAGLLREGPQSARGRAVHRRSTVFRRTPRPSRVCRASAGPRRLRSRRSRSASARRSSTATSSGCWPAISAWRATRLQWALAEAPFAAGHIETYTQALMDLGATVCVRASPECGACPLASDCHARKEGLVDRLPTPRQRKPSPLREATWHVLRHGGEVLLERRPDRGVWAGCGRSRRRSLRSSARAATRSSRSSTASRISGCECARCSTTCRTSPRRAGGWRWPTQWPAQCPRRSGRF